MEAVSPCELEDDPGCGACGEIFDEPVVLSCMCCGRSFCGACLLRHWESSGSQECPLCDREPRDLTACAEHGRRLTLFCLEDLRPVCPACPGSDSHGGHRVYPLKEAAHDCKRGDSMEAVSPSALEDDPCCDACGEVFGEPVVLSCVRCGRSFCGACLLRHWESSGSQDCPLCDREPRNLTVCAEHGRRLTLFCLEDLRPVCPACPESAAHGVNGVYPLKDAAHDCKVKDAAEVNEFMTKSWRPLPGTPRPGGRAQLPRVRDHILREPVVLSCRHPLLQGVPGGQLGPRRDVAGLPPLLPPRSSLEELPVSAVLERACESLRADKRLRDPAGGAGSTVSTSPCSAWRSCSRSATSAASSPNHDTHHRLYPLEEAAQDCKEELKNALIPLQDNLNLFQRAKLNCDQMAEHIKSQAVNAERQIQEQFEKLHQFLQEEEEAPDRHPEGGRGGEERAD
ncbi:hypothetical protein SKAU_G00295090 [Synaphobranchus kaupii]|uniref:Uncharacterized protein n=1 Tax=Synaphobranchus kaupii TaxID=118154 RepID=A0A9Q1EUL0_SYNKA|nr:hypothetical protein SKAU_G00295090 [Synaphobranchus kaupii]